LFRASGGIDTGTIWSTGPGCPAANMVPIPPADTLWHELSTVLHEVLDSVKSDSRRPRPWRANRTQNALIIASPVVAVLALVLVFVIEVVMN